ncbi:MAG: hypothetical protein KDA79_03585 [Planctomycetaceae bacterium]|nr:hypothetical protein [Planctomycetaceae bacterium]
MAESLVELDAVRFRRVFPWLHLFRGFWIAADVRKLLLAAAGVLLLSAGNSLIDQLPLDVPETARIAHWQTPETSFRAAEIPGDVGAVEPAQFVQTVLARPIPLLVQLLGRWDLVLRPMWTVIGPAAQLVSPGLTWSLAADSVLRLLLALVVWSLVGGAIVRMAAVEFARDERLPLRSALKFTCGKFLSFMGAPLLPAAALGVLALLMLLGGLIGSIPVAGPVIAGVLWIVPLVLALAMVVMLVGVVPGWPLMMAAIGAEGSDAFDGFSRSCSYVYGRMWNYLWYSVVNCILGSAGYLLVSLVVGLTVFLAARLVALGMGLEAVGELHSGFTLPLLGYLGYSDGGGSTDAGGQLGTMFVGWWLSLVLLLQEAFLYSWFWCASTISYFLLRLVDDATALVEVWLPEEDAEDDLLPLVGVAASDQPVIERPPVPGAQPEGRHTSGADASDEPQPGTDDRAADSAEENPSPGDGPR